MKRSPAPFNRDRFALGRFVNTNQAGGGSNIPPRQFGDLRVPIVTGLRIAQTSSYVGGTSFVLMWEDPPFSNMEISQYNVFASGIDGIVRQQGPFAAQASPAIIRVVTRVASQIVFTVQTQLSNGLVSPLDISPSVAGLTITNASSGISTVYEVPALTANTTITSPTSATLGDRLTVYVTQGAGPYTISWDPTQFYSGTRTTITAVNGGVGAFDFAGRSDNLWWPSLIL